MDARENMVELLFVTQEGQMVKGGDKERVDLILVRNKKCRQSGHDIMTVLRARQTRRTRNWNECIEVRKRTCLDWPNSPEK